MWLLTLLPRQVLQASLKISFPARESGRDAASALAPVFLGFSKANKLGCVPDRHAAETSSQVARKAGSARRQTMWHRTPTPQGSRPSPLG